MIDREALDRAIDGGDARAVAAVFASPRIVPADEVRLVREDPARIAGAEGAPYRLRDVACRRLLTAALRRLGSGDPTAREAQRGRLRALRIVEHESAQPDTSLVRLDVEPAEPRCTTAVGDLGTAGVVTVLVLGALSGVTRSLANTGRTARRLQAAVEARTGAGTSAVVVFLDAQSPSLVEVPFNRRAEEGAARLGLLLDGLRARNPGAAVTLAAHSYGSTLAATFILERGDASFVRQFIAYGSAGIPNAPAGGAPTRADFPGVRLFATEASADMEARWGRIGFEHPHDPTRMPGVFETFSSDGEGGREPVDSHRLEEDPTDVGHRGYLSAGTDSFDTTVDLVAALAEREDLHGGS